MSWDKFVNSDITYYNIDIPESRNTKTVFLDEQYKKEYNAPKESHATCKCGSKRIWISDKQTRSGDEGSTIFYLCHDCRSSWRT